MIRGTALALAVLVGALSPVTPLPGTPQNPPAAPPQRPGEREEDPRTRIRTTVELVIVPVTVKDRSGDAVLDLRREEFRILEDDIEQQIAVFSNDPFPLSVVVLLDNDLPLRTAEFVEKSAGAISGGLGPLDEGAVILFDQFPRTALEFTSDNDKFHDGLKRISLSHRAPAREGASPMTSPPRLSTETVETGVPQSAKVPSRASKNLDDAVLAAGRMLRERGRERRKIVFVVSDGRNSHNNTASFEDALRVLLSADISVYAAGVSEAVLNRGINPLAKYARATGGDVSYAATRSDLESLYARVFEQARNQYTLAFSPRGIDRSLDYHSLEVRVRRPGLTLLTRDGYYSVPPK